MQAAVAVQVLAQPTVALVLTVEVPDDVTTAPPGGLTSGVDVVEAVPFELEAPKSSGWLG